MIRKAACAALVVLLAVPAARAQEQPAPTGELVRIASIAPWVDQTHPFTLGMQVTNTAEHSLDGLSVAVTFYGRVVSRSQLRSALDHGAAGSIAGFSEPVDGSMEPGQQRSISISKPWQEFPVHRTGVYPIDIAFRDATGETTLHSAIPVLSGPPRGRINLVWILPVSRPIAVRPSGAFDRDALDALALDELVQQMRVVAGRPRATLTLAPNAALLDELTTLGSGFTFRDGSSTSTVPPASADAQRARDALDAMRTAASQNAVLVSPYAAADLTALQSNGLGEDLLRQVTIARDVIASTLKTTPASVLVTTGSTIDQGSASALSSLGISRFVTAPSTLTAVPTEPFRPDQFGASRPIAIKIGAEEAPALLIDTPLQERIDASSDGALLAQGLIAETMSAYLELPLFATSRVLVMASSRLPSPVALLRAIDGLTAAPWIRMLPATSALDVLQPIGDPGTLVSAAAQKVPYLGVARAARQQLALFNSITVAQPPEIPALDRMILMSESSEWTADPSAGAALANAVTARVRAVVRDIGVARRLVTLTSRSGQVPVTVSNRNPFPVRVRVRVDSAKLIFPAGAIRTEQIDPPSGSVDIPVSARVAGSFPLDVRVESPDGTQLLARGQVILRSTAISSVALSDVGAAVLLLMVSWVRRSRRRKPAATG
ncbi:MAG: DUF6049 family protein [Actinobacteria bacterium]|nr:DUF6049 family protein [Actinomycetota bacterium]